MYKTFECQLCNERASASGTKGPRFARISLSASSACGILPYWFVIRKQASSVVKIN